jgi:oxygen-independent coproporphyrinogen-3 oxidase
LIPPVTFRDRGLYVHFPYCAQKCPYCDFNSHAIAHDDRAYADAVLEEMDLRGPSFPGPLTSIYFGGGTPSRWDPAQVRRVIDRARAAFAFAGGVEITLEANPGSVAEARMFDYVDAGVNRFSIGVQSFDDAELIQLGRIHDGSAAETAVGIALRTGARVSLDLMYALPGQSWNDVRRSLDRAIALGPHHVSAYTLTIEPDTTLGKKTALGLFVPMPDDFQAHLIERVTETLESAGYARYEISSYARPGEESRHNCLYWMGAPYLGVGAGAHSYLVSIDQTSAIRRENVRRPDAYLARRDEAIGPPDFARLRLAARSACEFEERLDRAGIVRDRLMVGLRTRFGLDVAELPLSADERDAVMVVLRDLAERGWVRIEGTRATPTVRGFLMNDGIAKALLDAAPDPSLDKARDAMENPRGSPWS